MYTTMRQTLTIIVAAVAVGLAGCNVIRGQQDPGDYADDAALTARVKAALLDDESVEGTQINVNVYEGKVQLSGFADSPAERSSAERIAREVEGVRSVENNIQLKETGGAQQQGGSQPSPETAPRQDDTATPPADTTSPPRS